MRTVAFSVWSVLFARMRAVHLRHPGPDRPCALPPCEMPLHIKRDLGLLDGRDRRGQEEARQNDELRKALALLPRPL